MKLKEQMAMEYLSQPLDAKADNTHRQSYLAGFEKALEILAEKRPMVFIKDGDRVEALDVLKVGDEETT